VTLSHEGISRTRHHEAADEESGRRLRILVVEDSKKKSGAASAVTGTSVWTPHVGGVFAAGD
jgi:hypothetical protein